MRHQWVLGLAIQTVHLELYSLAET